ncbi:efflux RND transporter permease subunit [Wenzhouxiangella sp. AB-CW3]|uniref:efflux RND transporter permease subunit n=1 Tax=Wenzhouxiangella sp. AB-CW3 TaxID=2771012 RepID=UPI00168B98AB|nr:efflux RND transporter permease subunit [Wenzhouxiangella sp. AB-CW3]QOC21948.1 efflux RND transporter permease subunit [Wenzhouxiangella sp. AB-CW3]
MNLIVSAFERKRLVLAAVGLLSVIGLAAWLGMDRQEDPFFPYRYGHVLVHWPGAEAERMERLVLNVLEEEVASVDEINEINGTARLGFAHVIVGMEQHVYDTDTVWDRIRVAVDEAARRFPDGVTDIEIRDRTMDTHGVVLAVTGSDDLLELLEAARQLRRDLFRVPGIGRIDLLGDPGEQLLVTLDDARAAELGLTHDQVAAQLAERNLVAPGGTLAAGDRYLVLRPLTDFDAVEQLADTPIATANGDQVRLGSFTDIRLGPSEPAAPRVWHDGRPAVTLGIVIPESRTNAVRFGQQLREHLDDFRPGYEPLQIEEMFYQPQWVEKRIAELGRSLLIGVIIVASLLLAAMGLRLGLVVAGLLPLVTMSALAIYAIGGGVLHQMAIAGMVIALGMLVDNAIVMVENLQWHLDRGKQRAQAAQAAVRELAGPLAAATGTTLAAFTPLLLASGDTADFTRAIPIMVMLTLATSYLYAIFVTPTLAAPLLKPGAGQHSARIETVGRRLGHLAVVRPVPILIAAIAIVGIAVAMSGLMQRDFFPSTDRNEFIIDLSFSEGTRVEATALKGNELATLIRDLEGVEAVHVFAGFGGPRFYYNLIDTPNSPHLARLVVITDDESRIAGLLRWTRRHASELAPEAQIVARRLGQGPPIDAPIEVRLFGDDLGKLATASEQVMTAVRNTPGAVDVRHRLGEGIPTLSFEIDDSEAARHGISRRQIADTLAGASMGREFSTWRAGREPVPMRLRSPEGEQLPLPALDGLQVEGNNGNVPLAQLVRTRLSLEPAVIEHRDLQRKTAVLAETAEGVTYGQVIDRLMRQLDELSLPDDVRIELGGAAAEADTANTALFSTLPIGVLLLLVFLLWQFNSFRLVSLVLLTVPLAAAGVIPGLILAGQPFSFTATLGVVALIGIVVNNAIVLLDVIGRHRAQGLTMDQAISHAVGRRIRPILLTTATTVAGLLPLTFTQSTLWPPLAWAIISGLLAATVLTLLVIPAAYRLLMKGSVPGARL